MGGWIFEGECGDREGSALDGWDGWRVQLKSGTFCGRQARGQVRGRSLLSACGLPARLVPPCGGLETGLGVSRCARDGVGEAVVIGRVCG